MYENTALAGLGFLCMFGFPSFPLGDPPIIALCFHDVFHPEFPLAFMALCDVPCYYAIISEPSGIPEEPPRPFFLGTSLPLSW